ncbi:MAG TPA: tol-pal system-associated acyl-CoA thioesterase [Caldimonas sp.]|nr:tol-pal system-associated acyl-CoA thioesterase [Caldimonas sp.]
MSLRRRHAAARTPVSFRHPIRIYWEDTDAAGIVFYANYLKFFERARTEWLRSLGFDQERLRADDGIAFVVTETTLRYRLPARLDDMLEVTVRVVHGGQASLEVAQEAWRAGDLLAEGSIRVGCVGLGTFRPRRVPDSILAKIRTSPHQQQQ